jgi:hypothetical protein
MNNPKKEYGSIYDCGSIYVHKKGSRVVPEPVVIPILFL